MLRSRSSDSAKTSPPSSPRRVSLQFPDVANIFIRMRRVKNKTQGSGHARRNSIECASGTEPQSHPDVLQASESPRKECLERTDVYECAGAVVTPTLLRATRNALLETAEYLGANALVDEQWKCSIRGLKHGSYRVQVHYQASAMRSSHRDPRRPIALDQAKGVPGLMTIVKMNDT